jgi:hypothetical protein
MEDNKSKIDQNERPREKEKCIEKKFGDLAGGGFTFFLVRRWLTIHRECNSHS